MSLKLRQAAWRAFVTGILAFLGFWGWRWLRGGENVAITPLEHGVIFGVFFFIWTLVFGMRK